MPDSVEREHEHATSRLILRSTQNGAEARPDGAGGARHGVRAGVRPEHGSGCGRLRRHRHGCGHRQRGRPDPRRLRRRVLAAQHQQPALRRGRLDGVRLAGEFSLSVPAGTIRVAYYDENDVYAVEYYYNAGTLETATDIPMVDGGTATADAILAKANSISGHVARQSGDPRSRALHSWTRSPGMSPGRRRSTTTASTASTMCSPVATRWRSTASAASPSRPRSSGTPAASTWASARPTCWTSVRRRPSRTSTRSWSRAVTSPAPCAIPPARD